MPNPTTVADLEARFRPLTTDEETVAQSLLDDAWAVVLATVPDIEARMSAGSITPDVAVFVVASAVLRVLRNPNGVRSWSVDDYSETRDSSLSAGSLYLSEAEIKLLRGLSSQRGAFSVGPAVEPCPAPGAERDAAELAWLRYGYGPYRCW